MNRKSIALVHTKFGYGGSESSVMWGLQALKNDYDVYLVTEGEVDLDLLNSYYFTNIKTDEFSLLKYSPPTFLKRTDKFSALRGSYLARHCKRIAPDYDLIFNMRGMADFGVRGIQYTADLSFDDGLRRKFDPPHKGFKKLWYHNTIARRLYLKITMSISRPTLEGVKKNLTLVNSDWSGRVVKEHYGIETRTLYHPVAGNFKDIPYEHREDGFIFIARIVPEKRIELAIKILEEVRRRGRDIHLHIIGKFGEDKQYAGFVKRLCNRHKEWVFLEEGIYGDNKFGILAKHKYGINARENEPFGIVVAEMIKSGCIVFVPDSGGQVEIVDHHALVYQNIDDAVNKIERVLRNRELQNSLLKHLSVTAQRFSVENFIKDIKEIVADFLKSREPA